MNHLIELGKMQWNTPNAGVRYKSYTNGNQQIRLVEFSEGFFEED